MRTESWNNTCEHDRLAARHIASSSSPLLALRLRQAREDVAALDGTEFSSFNNGLHFINLLNCSLMSLFRIHDEMSARDVNQ